MSLSAIVKLIDVGISTLSREIRPRQVGKTTLLRMLVAGTQRKVLMWNCDEPDVRRKLSEPTSTELRAEIGDADLLLIDDAQRVKDIGITLKLMIDNFPEKQLVVTGSSAIELSNSLNEPLTGRKYEYVMYPFSAEELINEYGAQEERRMLERRLLHNPTLRNLTVPCMGLLRFSIFDAVKKSVFYQTRALSEEPYKIWRDCWQVRVPVFYNCT